ncbi:MAG: UDP-N-acetylmuramoyl-L-alanine--D-glutamate ligase [Clostridia bacterium]|nr:UDP-N-acetylmuramoyl-L-alanine--D-glutamate ligase [Clostridia bacterium]
MISNITHTLNGKNIVILGFGREGRSTLDFIKRYTTPLSVTVADSQDISVDGCKTVCGADYQKGLEEYDVIVKSPGVVYEAPTDEILEKTTSQTTLFLSAFADRCIGITGTKGKSTTTSLVYHVLKESGRDALICGNIGIPPLSVVDDMLDGDRIAVLEMSCHQLEYERYSPHIAVLLNLYEDHLDHYGTRDKYVDAKRNIYRNQSSGDVFVCNAECQRELSEAKGVTVSVGDAGDVALLDNGFVANGVNVMLEKDSTALVGRHNLFNIATAFAVVSRFGIGEADFLSALKSFRPLAHRLEYVATVNGVDYYDDSISTVCQTTIQAVTALENVDTVLVGGMDRGIDYTELVEFFKENPVNNIILMYSSGERIAKMLDETGTPYILAEDLERAVDIAVKVTETGKKCVLSPAAASYGYFKNFEHRGDVFCELLRKYQ